MISETLENPISTKRVRAVRNIRIDPNTVRGTVFIQYQQLQRFLILWLARMLFRYMTEDRYYSGILLHGSKAGWRARHHLRTINRRYIAGITSRADRDVYGIARGEELDRIVRVIFHLQAGPIEQVDLSTF